MNPVSPVIPGKNFPELKIGEHQKEYGTLPALELRNGVIVTRWKLSPEELETVKETGDIYLFIWTFGWPVQPLAMQTTLVDLPTIPEESTKEQANA